MEARSGDAERDAPAEHPLASIQGIGNGGCFRVPSRAPAQTAAIALGASSPNCGGVLEGDAHVGIVRIAFSVALEHDDPDEVLGRVRSEEHTSELQSLRHLV